MANTQDSLQLAAFTDGFRDPGTVLFRRRIEGKGQGEQGTGDEDGSDAV